MICYAHRLHFLLLNVWARVRARGRGCGIDSRMGIGMSKAMRGIQWTVGRAKSGGELPLPLSRDNEDRGAFRWAWARGGGGMR